MLTDNEKAEAILFHPELRIVASFSILRADNESQDEHTD
jgi:hypothetical protein